MPTDISDSVGIWVIVPIAGVASPDFCIGPFVSTNEATAWLVDHPAYAGPIINMRAPVLTAAQYQARREKSGFYSGTGPFEDEA